MSNAPKTLGAVLGQSRALNNKHRISWHEWRQVVGSRIANKSRPDFLTKGQLTVLVVSPAWSQELSFLSPTILERLGERGHSVQQLRYRVGAVTPSPLRPPLREVVPVSLPPELERSLAGVEDLELRAAISRAAGYAFARKLES